MEKSENICCFIPYSSDNDRINTINFVYETVQRPFDSLVCSPVYMMALVNEGTGRLHTLGKSQELARGDLFFIFASAPYAIESVSDFKYTYITFIGARANAVLDKLNINTSNCVFSGFERLIDFWHTGFGALPEMSDLMSEGILLYTFSLLGTAIGDSEKKKNSTADTVSRIKKYIDDNFSEADLDIEKISENLSYNKKYISSLFKSKFGIGISEYITVIRIQHACTLINQGFSCVKEIAALSGYKDAMYFSKVFKTRTGMTPSMYIKGAAE